jgi:hypothetical protein
VTAPSEPPIRPPWATSPPGSPGMRVGFPEMREPAPHGHRVSHVTMVALLVAGLAVLTGILVIVAVFAPSSPPPACPPFGCQGPPVGTLGAQSAHRSSVSSQLQPSRLYSNKSGFTVRYYPLYQGGATYPGISTNSDSITLTYQYPVESGGDSHLTILGQLDGGDTPQQIVDNEVGQIAPNAQVLYLLPGAYVGYRSGYGEAVETQVSSADGSSITYELIVMAAVHDGFGITVAASGGLLSQVTPDSAWWDGHPSPAAISVAYIANDTVDSITFPAGPPRR